jgi:putative membrane protein
LKKYLLERYPAIWNTQVVLLLPLIFLSHLVFFGLGFIMLTDGKLCKGYYPWGDSFNGLPMLLNFIIIVLLLVGWFIYLFRNNAFDRFYPVSRWQLFWRFVVYFAVILGIISTGFSFMTGEKAKVYWRYTDSYLHSVLQQYPEYISDSEMKQFSEAQREEYYIAHNASLIKERVFIEKFDAQINFIIIIAFLLTLLLFAVRITSLRTVLLSIVFSGLLCLLLGLVLILVLESNMFAIRDIYVVLTILWLTYLSMIALSIFSDKKQYRGIAMNISLFGFLPMTIVTLIAICERYDWWYPSLNIEEVYYYFWYDIKELIVSIGGILLSFVFVGLYTNVIKRWKAMPE